MTSTPSDSPLWMRSRSANAERVGVIPTGYSLVRHPPVSRSRSARSRFAAGIDSVQSVGQNRYADASRLEAPFVRRRVASKSEAADDRIAALDGDASRSQSQWLPVRRWLACSHHRQGPRRVQALHVPLHEQQGRWIGDLPQTGGILFIVE